MARTATSLIDWALQQPAVDLNESILDRMLVSPASRRERRYVAAKRAMDVVLAVFLIALAAPVMLLTALLIKVTSRGPVLFRQARAGRDAQPFIMYKFRTMVNGAEDKREGLAALNDLSDGPVFKLRNDPRLTLAGRLLRRTSIDELPQLFNVLRGEMALVGPRPLPLDEVETSTYAERRRLQVLPGLTCLWQISGRCDIPYREWLQLDLFYIQNRSLLLDLEILLKTVPAVLSCRGAY